MKDPDRIYNVTTNIINNSGEEAGKFNPKTKVWSEMAVRSIVLRVLKELEEEDE